MLSEQDPWQPEPLSLAQHGVEVHALAVRAAGPDWLDPAHLSPDERERQRRFSLAADRRSFLASHVLLRRILASKLGRSPGSIRLNREPCPLCGGPHGRPALGVGVTGAKAGIHFSLSRTSELVLVAVAETPVGVDVEPIPNPATVAEVTPELHPEEREQILSTPAEERSAVFARLWTRKEAYLKGVGSGIAGGLAEVNTGDQSGYVGRSGWKVRNLRLCDTYAAAAAVAVQCV